MTAPACLPVPLRAPLLGVLRMVQSRPHSAVRGNPNMVVMRAALAQASHAPGGSAARGSAG